MKKRRLFLMAAAFLLAAAMSVTAFAAGGSAENGSELKTLLDSTVSGDEISLTNNVSLPAGEATLKRGVSLKSSDATNRTLTAGSGVTFKIDLSAKVAGKVNIVTTGSGKVAFLTTDSEGNNPAPVTGFVSGAPKVGGKTATLKDGKYYVDTSANTANIEVPVNSAFDGGNTGASTDYPGVKLFLVDAGGITRDSENNITAIDSSKVYGGDYDSDNSRVDFSNVPVKNKTYIVMARVGGSGGSLVETADAIVTYDGSDVKVEAKSLDWANLKAGRAYDAFTVTNPGNFPVTAEISGSVTVSDYLTLTAGGKLTALQPMGKTGITVKFKFELPDGSTKTVDLGSRQTEIKRPVTAPQSAGVYTNQRTKIFTIDMPASGSANYAGYELTDVSANNGDIVFNLANGPEYITATKTMSGANVNFTFTFKDAAERAAAGTGKAFTITETVKVSASNYNPTHPISVVAPKLYIATGESIQLSVAGERINNATSGNLSVAFATGDGRVIGMAPGTATIHVTTAENGYGTIQVMVVGANAPVYASATVLAEDDSTQIYFGTGAAVSYAFSNNTRVVTVTNSGRVTAVAPGTATVYVTAANGAGGTITFTVTQKTLKVYGTGKIAVGATAQLTLAGSESIASVTSSNPSVVNVMGSGFYYGVKSGTATLTVTAVSGRVGTYSVTVTGGTTGTDSRTIQVGGTTQLTVAGDSIMAAYSENTRIATVTNSGKVTGVSAGTAVIHVYTRSGSHGTVIITVTGSSSSNTATAKTLLVDQSLTLKVSGKRIVAATLEDDNGTITVNNSGKVTALAAGTDTVLLITSDNAVRRVKITVNARGGRISISRNSKLRLRSRPGSGTTLAYLRSGNSVTILARSGSYYRVRATIGGKSYTGYVARGYVKKN